MRFLISALAAGCLLSCSNSQSSVAGVNNIDSVRQLEGEQLAQRGEYLVSITGCDNCHSPKIMTPDGPEVDSSRRLSGHPSTSVNPAIAGTPNKPGNWMNVAPDLTSWIGPWGISYTANLTPDTTTGIGNWTEQDFINTIRKGKHLGMDNGRPILPPMPWKEFLHMKVDDLRSIFAYLRSIPAINNKVPAPVPPNQVVAMSK